MALAPIGSTPVAPMSRGASVKPLQGAPEPGADKANFASLVEGLLEKANQPQVESDQAVKGLMTGQTNNVHDVILSTVKADLSFRMLLEVRNRLTEAYQEIMRMQV